LAAPFQTTSKLDIGTCSCWYKDALQQKAGRIRAAGMTKEVAFEPVGGQINDRIDRLPHEMRIQPICEADGQ
jgi:hypothetical protein